MSKVDCGAFYLVKIPGRKYWHVRAFAPNREPLFRSTGQTEERQAKKAAKAIYDDWARAKTLQPGDKILFEDLWAEFVQFREPYLSTATFVRMKSVGTLHLLPAFKNCFLNEVQAAWNSFVINARQGRSKSTLFNERKYLLAALQYAFKQGLIDREPHLPSIKSHKKAGKVYSDAEIRKLLVKCKSDELRLQILMALTMGMRFGEIIYLEHDRIDLEAGAITLGEMNTKTRQARTIQISKDVIDALRHQVEKTRRLSPWLFPQKRNHMQPTDLAYWQKLFQDLKTAAGVTGRFHDLRHTAATKLAQSGVSAEVACAYLGMSLRVYDSTYCPRSADQ